MMKDSIYLFVNRSGGKNGDIKTAWGNAVKRAGIVDFRFHDLRHTAATRLGKAKIPERVIAEILGHKRKTITGRYINPQWKEMVEAMSVLGDLCHVYVPYDVKAKNAENLNKYKIN